MKIVFFGDSITDMARTMLKDSSIPCQYGVGYVQYVVGNMQLKEPNKYQFVNVGISGNRSVDLYARIKGDVWDENPDVLSILIGVNDIWHDIGERPNGVEIDRFEKIYRMLIEDTKAKFPNIKIMLIEPFVLHGSATDEKFETFCKVYDYAKVVKKLAKEYNLYFLPLQEKFNKLAQENGASNYLYDGVHPNSAGACFIANEWMNLFNSEVK